jgi:hypothetical protein
LKVEFVPVRWWQAVGFIRLNFEVVGGHDPWADRILSRPWAPSSLIEYAYMLVTFPGSNAYFIVASGERVGVLWMIRHSGLFYILSLGLLPHFRARDTGMQIARLLIRTVRFIEDYAKRENCEMGIARIATMNKPIQRMVRMFGANPLGLATTTLALSTVPPPTSSLPDIEVRQMRKSEAVKAWRRWRLYEVEHVAGRSGVEVAANLLKSFYWLDSFPRGEYLALYQNKQEIGFAFARQHEGEHELGLLPSATFWAGPQTVALVTVLASYLDSPVRYLTLTQKHADALDTSTAFDFERNREQERHFVFWLTESYFGRSSR